MNCGEEQRGDRAHAALQRGGVDAADSTRTESRVGRVPVPRGRHIQTATRLKSAEGGTPYRQTARALVVNMLPARDPPYAPTTKPETTGDEAPRWTSHAAIDQRTKAA